MEQKRTNSIRVTLQRISRCAESSRLSTVSVNGSPDQRSKHLKPVHQKPENTSFK